MSFRRLDTILLLAAFMLLWDLTSHLVGTRLFSPPLATLTRAMVLLGTHAFWLQAASTAQTLISAWAIVLVGGMVAGCLIGLSKLLTEAIEPLLAPIYAIPKIALYPVILLMFGLTPLATIVFAALHGIFPVMIFTINGIRKVRPIYVQVAQVTHLSRVETVRAILIPAALPEIVNGIKVGFSTTLFGALIAELFASAGGVGFMLIRATEAHNMMDVMAITVLLFAFAVSANLLLARVETYVRHDAG